MSDVPEGYKQSGVGVIPEEWEVKKLGVVADVKTGPFGSSLHERDYVNDGTPIITVEHLGEQGVVHKNLPMVSDFDRKRLNAYALQPDDIVFSRVGSVDRNSLIKEKENGWLFSGRLLRIRLTTKFILPSYLSYYFHQEPTKQRIRSVAVGQTMASLNTEILKNIEVAIPPTIEEQQAIASALSDVDALIAALEQLITKKRNIKQGAMQQLLTGKKRLPGFGGAWEVKKLGEIADIISGGTPSTIISEFWNGDIKWCTPTDITRTKQKYLLHTEKNISEKGLKNSSATLLPVGALLLCSRATIGEIRIAKDVVCTNQGFNSMASLWGWKS
jgi:type I restriction enzyme S subunit